MKTSNSPEQYLYRESIDRMSDGNFYLRSCNDDCESDKIRLIKHGSFIKHGCKLEKVLGFRLKEINKTMKGISG